MDEAKVYFEKEAFVDGLRQSSPSPLGSRPPIQAYKNGNRSWKASAVEIKPFTKIPNKFFGSGTAATLGPSASITYFALCEHANRKGDLTFRASDKALASDTGLGTRTICDARKKLMEKRLITCKRVPGQSFVYTLIALLLKWAPASDRPRNKLQPRALYTQNQQGGAAKFAEVVE
jgi:hypothetical protein